MMGEKPTARRRLRQYFVAGLLVIIPLALTIAISWKVFILTDSLLSELTSRAIYCVLGLGVPEKPIPGIGIVTLLLLVLLVGILARNFIGKRAIRVSEKLLNRIPVIRQIYGTLQQISQAFLADHSEVFKRAVLIEYPRPGIYSIGFITQDTKGVVQHNLDEDVLSIFLPTTPNPTSGFLLFVPKNQVKLLNLSVEEALKLVISGGAIVPSPGFPLAQDDSFDFPNPPAGSFS
ncbi:MAG TPA: DUF502 domain-containing protein [bacterium]|nr:DUF502 domain-containing protein [bacterium]